MKVNETMIYKLKNLDVKKINFVADEIDYIECNHGHSSYVMIDNQIIENMSLVESGTLAYIKFLGEEIGLFRDGIGKYVTANIESPSIKCFLIGSIIRINDLIIEKLEKGERPYPTDILEELNQKENYNSLYYILYDVIKFIMACNGYAPIPGTSDKIQKIDSLNINFEDALNKTLDEYDIKIKTLNKIK